MTCTRPKIAKTRSSNCDGAVILLDLQLPPTNENMDGGLAALAKVLELAPHTKIIVLIDNVGQEIALSAVAQGAYNFYKKPVDPDILRLIVNRARSPSRRSTASSRPARACLPSAA